MIFMCGIGALINFKGITQEDLEAFTLTFAKNDSRGKMACGVGLQNLNVIKAIGASSEFVKTDKYKKFIQSAIGQQWIVGHTRHATQGDPAKFENDHPISLMRRKYLVIHNGVVGTNKFVVDPNKTDSYAIAEAIKRNWIEGDLQNTVKKAYSEFWGYAATITWTPKQICLAAYMNPIRRGTLQNGALIISSDTDYFPPKTDEIFFMNRSGGSVCFNCDGSHTTTFVKTLDRPSYTTVTNWDYFVDEEDDEEKDYFKKFRQAKLNEGNKDVVVKAHEKNYPRHSYFAHREKMDELERKNKRLDDYLV